MNKFRQKKPVFLLLILALVLIVSAVVMLLWNAILPDVLGVKFINYWQALGIFILSKILFGGFNPVRRARKRKHMRSKFKERFLEMDEEQKSIFKEEWKKRNKNAQ